MSLRCTSSPVGKIQIFYFYHFPLSLPGRKFSTYTLIEIAEFGVETVLMGKTCNFDSNLSNFNSVDLKKAQKLTKAK
jgi:hypothetical protein